MQTLIKCPECGSSYIRPYHESGSDHNVKCHKCGHTWRWKDE